MKWDENIYSHDISKFEENIIEKFFSKELEKKIKRKDRILVKSLTQFLIEAQLDKNSILDNYIYQYVGLSDSINERYGTFNGQIDLIKYILEKIKKTKDKPVVIKDDEIKKILDKPFFKSLTINYHTDENDYDAFDVEYLDDENVFDNITINLGTPSPQNLAHELTHAWHDYSLYIQEKGLSLDDLMNDEKHRNRLQIDFNVNHILSKLQNKNNLKPNDENDIEYFQILRRIIHANYLISHEEKNAFASELESELLNYEGQIISFNKFKEIFQNSDTYKEFKKCESFLDEIYNNEKYKDRISYIYNGINKTNLSTNKAYKKIKRNFQNYFDRVTKNAAKIYCNWVENQKILSTPHKMSDHRLED